MRLLQKQNMKYKLVIFDFDGTIADTSEGIIDSHKYVLKRIGKAIPSDKELYNLIGGNLLDIYTNYFGFTENVARELVKMYRERYALVGIHKAKLYPNLEELLKYLKERGIKIAIATLKAETFAIKMVNELEISQYFDCICGMDIDDKLTKAKLVEKCMNITKCDPDNAILIGDTLNDYKGAVEADVDFLGVSYGFGLKKKSKYKFNCCDVCDEIKEYF